MFSRVVKQGIFPRRFVKSIELYNLCPTTLRLCNYFHVNNLENQRRFSINSPIVSSVRQYSDVKSELTETQFINICEETLFSLSEYLEDVALEHLSDKNEVDIFFEGSILKIDLGIHGTYVINRQIPNRQIWLSSPVSGPKRYDFVKLDDKNGYWVYKHDGVTLHKLLETEMKKIISKDMDFSKCSFSKT